VPLALDQTIKTAVSTRKIGSRKKHEYIHDKVSVKLVKDMLEWQTVIKHDRFDMPLLLSHCDSDPITPFEASRAFFERVDGNDKDFFRNQRSSPA
jgi:hypothetical protein